MILKNSRVLISIFIAILFIFPTIVVSEDTTSPEISEIWFEPEIQILGEIDYTDYYFIDCRVTDNIPGELADVRINISGPDGFSKNESMIYNGYHHYYYWNDSSMIFNDGTYYFYIWAVDNSGNSNTSDIYHIIIIESLMDNVYVDDSNTEGPWYGTIDYPFDYINNGLTAVNNGGTVYVYDGMYYDHLKINKRIILEGESRENTIISSGGHVIEIENTNNVEISNFTIRNGDQHGIYITSPNCRITNCDIYNNKDGGIYCSPDYSSNISIMNCDIYNNGDNSMWGGNNGIYLGSLNIINNCNIYNNYNHGIHLVSSNNQVTNCNVYNNGESGLYLSSSNNQISYCNFSNNDHGIHFTEPNNMITNCDIFSNDYGIYVDRYDNTIYHNNFVDNTIENAYRAGSFDNIWDDGITGNYWSDYKDEYPDAVIEQSTGTWDTSYEIPTYAAGIDYDFHPWEYPNGMVNEAPNTPNKPTGPMDGETGKEYTYSTNHVTDPEDDEIYYIFDWGDGTDTGWINDPMSSKYWINEGSYNIKVKAKDVYGIESDWSDEFTITISGITIIEPRLEIDVPSEITEGKDFEVTITSDNTPLSGVEISFRNQIKTTLSNGKISFSAPYVNEDTIYTISASKSGYKSNNVDITIKNEEEQPVGFIYGDVYDGTLPIEKAEILISSKDKSWVFKTDEDGRYIATINVGSYTVSASKDGYDTEVEYNVDVKENTANNIYFTLEKSSSASGKKGGLADYIIKSQIEKGDVGAKIDGTSNHVTLYSDLDIEIVEAKPLSKGKVIFTVSGDEITTLLVIYISDVKNHDKVKLSFDGEVVKSETDTISFFDTESIEKRWIIIPTDTKGTYVVLLKMPLSEHTITISSVIDAIGGITTLIFYIVIGVIASMMFIAPTVLRYLRRRYFQKRIF